MFDRMRPYAPSGVILFLMIYFGVQALTGERGLLSTGDRLELLARRNAELAALHAEREALDLRVRYLRTGHLSRDLLEERARVLLGFTAPGDYVIPAPPARPTGA